MEACPGTRCHHFPASAPAVQHSVLPSPGLRRFSAPKSDTVRCNKLALCLFINDGQTNVNKKRGLLKFHHVCIGN